MVQLALVDTVSYNPITMTSIQVAGQLMENVEADLNTNDYGVAGFRTTPNVSLAVTGIILKFFFHSHTH